MTPKSAIHAAEEHAGGDVAWPDLSDSSILIVDDEPGMRSFLVRALRPKCKAVEAAADTEEAEKHLAERHFDIVVVDNVMPGKSGIVWLEEQRREGTSADFILITAYADLDSAIGAIRAGAADFLLKPFRTSQLLAALSRCLERGRLQRENAVLRHELHGSGAPSPLRDKLTGSSRVIQATRDLIAKVAPLPSSVLFTGESGVGKEVAARSLHSLSTRASNPFIPINCAAIPAELIDSELFGHLKGAFNWAQASRQGLVSYAQGGTLFFDELADLPLAFQGKLLRMLEDRRIRPVGAERETPIDVRFVFATNKNLVAAVKDGTFRSDLFYRINVLEVQIPRLHDRGTDVLELAAGFMRELGLQLGLHPIPFDERTRAYLQHYSWPGNVRELHNYVERSLILGHFPSHLERLESLSDPRSRLLSEVERRHILAVLRETGGDREQAASILGISRKTIDRKCSSWNASA
ncbi:TPA: sigma-54-dependent Fis family transcriptional regulator [Stenotrophomonas maltophilia]|nr:sigma-54-dependent Fis family transcriptional regulator [Stenotrophomonas maltophilia]